MWLIRLLSFKSNSSEDGEDGEDGGGVAPRKPLAGAVGESGGVRMRGAGRILSVVADMVVVSKGLERVGQVEDIDRGGDHQTPGDARALVPLPSIIRRSVS